MQNIRVYQVGDKLLDACDDSILCRFPSRRNWTGTEPEMKKARRYFRAWAFDSGYSLTWLAPRDEPL